MNIDTIQFQELIHPFLENGQAVIVKPKGRSMSPSIMAGSTVRVTSVSFKELTLGDIVVFRLGNSETAMHRLILKISWRGKQYFQTWGDNKNILQPDLLLSYSSVIGKITAVEVGGSWQDPCSQKRQYMKLFLMKYWKYYFFKFPLKALQFIFTSKN